MFGLDITTEKLFNDPQLLTLCLEELSSEIEHPYVERKNIPVDVEIQCKIVSEQSVYNDIADVKAVIGEVDKREAQMKILIDFISTMRIILLC